MLVVMPSSGDPARMCSHLLFPEGTEIVVVVDSIEDADKLISEVDSAGRSIRYVVCNCPQDIPKPLRVGFAQNFILQHLVPHGEWSIWTEDYLPEVTALREDIYNDLLAKDQIVIKTGDFPSLRKIFFDPVQPERMMRLMEELRDKCMEIGTGFGGVKSFNDNPIFRMRKWWRTCLVTIKLAVLFNDGRQWLNAPNSDMERSFYSIANYGACLMNCWVYYSNKYSHLPGGIGTPEERKPFWEINAPEIRARYPGLAVANPANDLQFKIGVHGKNKLMAWRKEHGYA